MTRPRPRPPRADVRSVPNNAARWWFRDKGLRRLSVGICVGFLSSVNYGASCNRARQGPCRCLAFPMSAYANVAQATTLR